ncbi:41045_t:CDS:1, partial [Gigaspora margarita]
MAGLYQSNIWSYTKEEKLVLWKQVPEKESSGLDLDEPIFL